MLAANQDAKMLQEKNLADRCFVWTRWRLSHATFTIEKKFQLVLKQNKQPLRRKRNRRRNFTLHDAGSRMKIQRMQAC
jgi:hypothetical protein